MQVLPSAGMKVNIKGEYYSQWKGFEALSGISVYHLTGTEAHIGHRNHLRTQGNDQCSVTTDESVIAKANTDSSWFK